MTSIANYYAKIKSISDALYLTGYQVEEEDLIMNLLVGLPFEHDAIINTIASWEKVDALTFQEVQAILLLSQECRIEQNTTKHNLEIQASANFSIRRNHNQGTGHAHGDQS